MILTVEVRKKESRGQRPFAKYGEKNVVVAVFCYNHCGEKDYWERKYTIGETGEPAEEEKEKMEREYSKTYAKKIYIIIRKK